ncbi:MAG TPA: NADH-quinone oxidoreductase subunit C [Gemmatimonadaceae bacterium]|nr:NADH-quinone oxidoreductase subunit C [Gemmatimonadaceae bacterium]
MSQSLPSYPSTRPGSAREAAGLPAPVTPHGLAHHGGPENPSVAALRARFGDAIGRSHVMWGDTTVLVAVSVVHDVIAFLRDEPAHAYNYLVDVTAVEYRDAEQPMEIVWHLRSLPWQRFLRLKVEVPRGDELVVPSITDLYASADWLERECYDMFGVTFTGHPDLRRILMWDTYREGHPLRKDFPLRGRFSRAEQLSQALSIDTVGRYSMTELTIAEAFDDLPADMKARLAERRAAELARSSDAPAIGTDGGDA